MIVIAVAISNNRPSNTGYFLVYPQVKDVHFLDDSDKHMKSYLFRMRNKPHRFCPDCSSNVLIDISQADDIPEMMKGKLAVNVSSPHPVVQAIVLL